LKFRHDEIISVGSHFSGSGEPASEVGFEGIHVGCAGEFGLAGYFIGYVVGEEDIEGLVEKTVYAAFPDLAAIGLGVVRSRIQ
jgi:hypothetical protein